MFFPFYDWTIIILIPAIILSLYAQMKISSAYGRYSKVLAQSGFNGAQVARTLLDNAGLYDVIVEPVKGHLSDHYDPRKHAVRLSEEIYYGRSLASLAVAAHETGHALQHADSYVPLTLRSMVVPLASFGSNVGPILIILGLFMGQFFLELGIILFTFAVVFQLITLPVEFNASSRAIALLTDAGMLTGIDEERGARKVLSAAALTYVAAALAAVLTLLRFVVIAQGRSND